VDGFSVWLCRPPAGLGAEVERCLARQGFRTETLRTDELAALAETDHSTHRIAEYIVSRFVARGFVCLIESRTRPASRWPDLVVSCGDGDAQADLSVSVADQSVAAVAEQIFFEMCERNLTEIPEGDQAVLERLKTIGYLG
jgi:hypothetical protein